jgi:hypothetical protein
MMRGAAGIKPGVVHIRAFMAGSYSIVIARLDRATQYYAALAKESRSRGVLDTPLEPVIGLAKGETRWRG